MPEKSSCPSQTALEEYAAELNTGKEQTDIKKHLGTCAQCREKVAALENEANCMRQWLLNAENIPRSKCPHSTVLAAYVDRALKPEQRTEIETHAAKCRNCQKDLKRIHKDTRDVLSEESHPYLAQADTQPVKLAERKPAKRTRKQPQEKKPIRPNTDDAQTRKKRLSSDYD